MAVVVAVAEPDAEPILVTDLLAGFMRLQARSPTLGGSLPLRAAQACLPLLEGNSVGRQLVITSRIQLVRGLTGLVVERWENKAAVEARLRGVLPVAVAQELVLRAAIQGFRASPIRKKGRRTIQVFTGLVIEVPRGVRLRISSSANNRARSYRVVEQFIEAGAPKPLILELEAEAGTGPISLEGEVATLIPLPADFEARPQSLTNAVDAAEAHVRFFDASYFATKKKRSARKYRDHARAAESSGVAGVGPTRVVDAGPRQLHIAGDRLVMRAGLPLEFCFDGRLLDVNVDPKKLETLARAIVAAWTPLLEGELRDANLFKGALLYLTKYVTPHPPGEPHFFVKPPALVVTPKGWSTLIEGSQQPGFDVMRGVVRTDMFHAVPAVFQVAAIGQRHTLAEGAPLAELFPAPRSVLERPFRERRLSATEALDA